MTLLRKSFLILLLSFFPGYIIFAQVPDGGIMLNRETGSTFQTIGKCTATEVPVSDQEFTTAIEVKVGADVNQTWDAIIKFPSVAGFAENDVILVAFWARTTSSLEETGEGSLNVVIEQNTTWTKQLTANVHIGGDWKEYYARAEMNSALTQAELNMIFHIGFPSQTVELADVRFLNYQNTLTLEDLPETGITYFGQAPDAAWRSSAQERINQIRKGGANITVYDENGAPLEGAQIHVEMDKHQFGFGTAIAASEFNGNATYRNMVLEHFNEVVFENDLKWPQFIYSHTHPAIERALDSLDIHGIPARGHNVIWPSYRFTPDIVEDLKDNPEALRNAIDKRIDEVVTFTKGRLNDWDVINEPYSEHDIQDILGDEVMADWFKRTRRIDRGVKLYLNDYSILSGAGTNVVKQDYYYGLVQDIEAWGGEINGIGMQGHFGTDLTSIPKVYSILERFADLEKDIKITEFDINTTQRDVQAEYTRDFMTIVFSHPSVKSIMVWGFWANRHWKPESAFYEGDWTIRPHGEVWNDMIKNQWWTPEQDIVSDASGNLSIEGFLGNYSYTLSYGDVVRTGTFSLEHSFESGLENEIILSLDGALPESVEITPSQLGYICSGEQVTLHAPEGDGLSYLWQLDGENLDQEESSILAGDSGSYTVAVSSNGISLTSDPYLLEVHEAPESEIAADGDLVFCGEGNVTLSVNNFEEIECEWFRNDMRIQCGVNPQLSAYMQGDYRVEVISDGCISASDPVNIVAKPLPDVSLVQIGESTFCSGESITLRANVQSNVIYNWYKGEELLEETGHLLTVSEAGSYSLHVSRDDCSNTSLAKDIVVLAADAPECTVGIAGEELKTRVYPNPFQGSFQVDLPFSQEGNSRLELYDAGGNLVHRELAESGTNSLTLSIETPGLYTLRIISGEHIQVHKLISQ